MFHIRRFLPHPALRNIIMYYTYTEVDQDGDSLYTMQMSPSGFPALGMVLNDHFSIVENATNTDYSFPFHFMGQAKQFHSFSTNMTRIVNVVFYPWGAYQLFGVPQHEFSERGTDAGDLMSNVTMLYQKLAGMGNGKMDEVVKTIDQYLLALMSTKRKLRDTRRVEHACRLIFTCHGSLYINTLINELHTTKSRLQDDFKTIIGLPPKALSRIVRYNVIMQRLQDMDTAGLEKDIYAMSFYDQAHFIKEFKNFSGTTPKSTSFDNNLCAQLSRLCLPGFAGSR